ncbi:MAG: hypothetical protein GY828_03105 [Candidatus Gracilibacteria bacterium]|nr:hypothetical protein [Candidatus Gracilibacteria bacterium]
MDSNQKLYEELLKEHPELKNSEKDIKQVIGYLQELNPNITVDEIFKQDLKDNVLHVANYNPIKSQGKISWLLYLVPTMCFGFAIFGFMYFSEDFQPERQLEITEIELINQELSLPTISEITSQEDDSEADIGRAQFKGEESPEPVKIKSPENGNIQELRIERILSPENTDEDDMQVVKDNDDQINEREIAPAGIMMDQMSIETFSEGKKDVEEDSEENSTMEKLEDNSIIEMFIELDETEEKDKIDISFESFCEDLQGEFIQRENEVEKYCKKDEKICTEEEYKKSECFDSKTGE